MSSGIFIPDFGDVVESVPLLTIFLKLSLGVAEAIFVCEEIYYQLGD